MTLQSFGLFEECQVNTCQRQKRAPHGPCGSDSSTPAEQLVAPGFSPKKVTAALAQLDDRSPCREPPRGQLAPQLGRLGHGVPAGRDKDTLNEGQV